MKSNKVKYIALIIVAICVSTALSHWIGAKGVEHKEETIKELAAEAKEEQRLEKEMDHEPPKLLLTTDKIIIYEGDEINYGAFIKSAWDEVQGDLTQRVTSNLIDTSKEGDYIVRYDVQDRAGNKTHAELKVTVRKREV